MTGPKAYVLHGENHVHGATVELLSGVKHFCLGGPPRVCSNRVSLFYFTLKEDRDVRTREVSLGRGKRPGVKGVKPIVPY